MRATGRRLGNPAAEQAEGPPTNPVERADACAMYRASQRPRAPFERVWGAQAFAIQWPSDVEQVCNQPGPSPANDPMPVHPQEARSRPRRCHVRSDGAVNRLLRGLRDRAQSTKCAGELHPDAHRRLHARVKRAASAPALA